MYSHLRLSLQDIFKTVNYDLPGKNQQYLAK
jgi:hypothetical protein